MRGVCTAFLLLFLSGTAMWQGAQPMPNDPVVNKRAVHLAEELRCLVCQNQTIADSNAELAADLRGQIRDQIAQGKTDAQIIDFMVDRYGDFVLYRPPVKPSTWLLWAGPFGLMILGVGALFVYLRRRSTDIGTDVLTDDERKRAEAMLQEGEK